MSDEVPEYIDAELRARAHALGSGEDSTQFGWFSWTVLGYDVAATGIGHYALAIRELWPGERPVPDALDRFRVGYAGFMNGRGRPMIR